MTTKTADTPALLRGDIQTTEQKRTDRSAQMTIESADSWPTDWARAFGRAPSALVPTRRGDSLYRIRVRDLLLMAEIGVHSYERKGAQRVRINLDMAVEIPAGPIADEIGKVLCYEDVVTGIKAILAEGHVNLVETLADRIAAMCLQDVRVARARVEVEKLDVYPEAAGVGVEVERERGWVYLG